MTPTVQSLITVIGRVLLSMIFLMSAVGNKIPEFKKVSGLMAQEGIPAPNFMLACAIIFLIGGSLMVMLGYKARIGATLLFVFLILATYFFHDSWTWPNDTMWVLSTNEDIKMPVKQVEMISFMKNLALMGAMLMIIANGPGPMSLDERAAKARQKSENQAS